MDYCSKWTLSVHYNLTCLVVLGRRRRHHEDDYVSRSKRSRGDYREAFYKEIRRERSPLNRYSSRRESLINGRYEHLRRKYDTKDHLQQAFHIQSSHNNLGTSYMSSQKSYTDYIREFHSRPPLPPLPYVPPPPYGTLDPPYYHDRPPHSDFSSSRTNRGDKRSYERSVDDFLRRTSHASRSSERRYRDRR